MNTVKWIALLGTTALLAGFAGWQTAQFFDPLRGEVLELYGQQVESPTLPNERPTLQHSDWSPSAAMQRCGVTQATVHLETDNGEMATVPIRSLSTEQLRCVIRMAQTEVPGLRRNSYGFAPPSHSPLEIMIVNED